MRVTQEQIAKMAGVSRGTVYRALNGSGPVKPEVSARILKLAEEMGYRPNRAGVALVRANRPLRIGVIIQSAETAFMLDLIQYVRQWADQRADDGVEVLLYENSGMHVDQQLEVLADLLAQQVDGLALTPIEDERIFEALQRFIRADIPVITVNTDMPTLRRLCYVGQEHFQAGRACAGLMQLMTGGTGQILMVTGHTFNLSHQRRTDGFRSEVLYAYPELSLLPMERCYENQQRAYDIVSQRLADYPDLCGIYISANGQTGICNAVRDAGLKGKVHIICHDLTEENVTHVKEGLIDFIVDQDAQTQAQQPLELLTDYLLRGVKPPHEFMLTKIHYCNRYNL